MQWKYKLTNCIIVQREERLHQRKCGEIRPPPRSLGRHTAARGRHQKRYALFTLYSYTPPLTHNRRGSSASIQGQGRLNDPTPKRRWRRIVVASQLEKRSTRKSAQAGGSSEGMEDSDTVVGSALAISIGDGVRRSWKTNSVSGNRKEIPNGRLSMPVPSTLNVTA